ncbi:GNAT family N-acetyltransferase [Virgibacillus profundi]|uniref:GNAT family N-acetyltransferase n=1 Tax=Virgibacillus profundi TaxID=2024555 RepID=A0A2A2II48_9BACI|nr:GNAT family N-acetyltransferase [Virgibacillus profundi]PAV30976.1 GNAT family N-acetyltransferase [Virgibacillus profundi]PXY55161.1 GNAT family N-acetyltransferase [Virgibacillus profundi]
MKYVPWKLDRLDDLINLWNKELSEEFPMRKELFVQNSFRDINVFEEGSLIAVDEEDQVIGFIVAKKWNDELDVGISKKTGWIQALLVDHNHRHQGIGEKLLNHAESKLKERGTNHIWLGRDTWHYFPGVPAEYKNTGDWFERRGYQYNGEDFDLDHHYKASNRIESIPEKEGVEVSLLKVEEKDPLLSFLHHSFPGRWEYEAIQYFQKGGTGREFVVLKKQDKIIGFCRINDSKSPVIAQNVNWDPLYQGELAGIGPLGIASSERKHGYGLFIVEAAVAFLRQRRIHSILIDWTGLVSFYNKLGFEVCKSYYSYQKYL